MRVACALILLSLVCSAVHAQDCDEQELDPNDMSDIGLGSTGDLGSKLGLNPEEVEKQLTEGTRDAGTDFQAIVRGVDQFSRDAAGGDLELDNPKDVPNSETWNQYFVAYKSTCPYYWKWINNLKWYFAGNEANQYCWSYYKVAITVCSQKYCGLSKAMPVWSVFYRCYPEYRTIWLYARCLNVSANGEFTWSNRFIRHVVSRGCCCRRYYNYSLTAANKCEAVRPQ